MPEYRVMYVYTPWRLWLPYGIAIALTMIVVAIGFVTMLLNGASYSVDFSTFFRTAKASGLSVKIQEEDLQGRDPLPKYLAKAWVTMARQESETHDGLRYRRLGHSDLRSEAMVPRSQISQDFGSMDGTFHNVLQRSTTRSTM